MKIWIVDDDPGIRCVVGRVLAGAGYEVSECAEGQEALERRATARPDLVVLDLEMPILGGRETLKAWRERGHGEPVLVLTSTTEVASCVRELENGADDFSASRAGQRN